jgi:hypothetical protein
VTSPRVQRGLGAMLARERLMPAPGLACRRSAYLGGAMRVSTRPAVFVDSSSMLPRRTSALALRCRRLAWGDMATGLWRRAFDDRGARFISTLRTLLHGGHGRDRRASRHSATSILAPVTKTHVAHAALTDTQQGPPHRHLGDRHASRRTRSRADQESVGGTR